jgi:phage terminase small subunit
VSDEAQETRPKRLTPKQAAFVQEYLVDLNATQAAIRAGYSEDTAYSIGNENLSKPEIADAIQAAMDQRAARTRITTDYVLATVYEVVERCKQATPVLDRQGMPVLVETANGTLAPAYVFDSKSALKGAELLGKHLKLFNDRVEHTGRDGGPIETADMTETEIARRIAFALAKGVKAQEKPL